MNVYVSADMEGTAGVASWDEVLPGRREYGRGQHLMIREVNAAVEGALDAGADVVLVNDAHDGQHNLEPEELHPGARLLSGRTKRYAMVAGAEAMRFDVALFTGYHAAQGRRGVLAHTWTGGLTAIRVNGELASETRFNAAMLGEWGIPVGMVTGDEELEEEVRTYLADVEYVAVKRPMGEQAAISLPPSRARELIRRAAHEAVKRAGSLEPYRLSPPLDVEVSFTTATAADRAHTLPRSRRAGPYAVAYTAESVEEAYLAMRAMVAMGGD